MHGEDSWYGVTYRWNDDQSDAELLTGAEQAAYAIATIDGGRRDQVWAFPARVDCLACHNLAAGGALGLRTHQLNGEFVYPRSGITNNQLVIWNELGIFDPVLDVTAIPGWIRSVEDDTRAPLEDRARSYLDANCSYCHRPETGNRALFDARLTTPLDAQGLLNGSVVEPLGLPDEAIIHPGCIECSVLYRRMASLGRIAMPPLLKNRVDIDSLGLIQMWIESLEAGDN